MQKSIFPFQISNAMFREQRNRLGERLRADRPPGHAAFFQASAEIPINSTDCNYLFVQESYFYYLFGSELPDTFGLVLSNGRGILFIPRLPEDYATWMGTLPTPDSMKALLEVDEVYYVDEMSNVFRSHDIETVEVLHGVNSDSGLQVKTAEFPSVFHDSNTICVSDSWLFNTLSYQRCIKSNMEADVLRYVCKVSSDAHVTVMQNCKPGMSQYQLESRFLHEVYSNGGCRRVSYTCICATGHHGATLHYPNNDALVENGTMALLDMGGNYKGYAADITCSFPVNGKFTEDQKIIYTAVLDAHNRVLRKMKPGVSWVDMHLLALSTMCEHLVQHQILIGSVEELMKKKIMKYFQPHGLGHLLGLDVHDVGGYMDGAPPRPSDPDCTRLRTARILESGYYITVEPGCYFNQVLLTNLFHDSEFKGCYNEERIKKDFWDFGGVRIESDVLVTPTGIINFTTVPRTVEEIERTMRGEPFQKEVEQFNN